MADQHEELRGPELARAIRGGLRSVLERTLAKAEEAVAEVAKAEALAKTTPPGISEETAHKIKREYPGDKGKAYATMWSIHNRMSKSLTKGESGVKGMARCSECQALLKVDKNGRLKGHKPENAQGESNDCPGSNRFGKVHGGPDAPVTEVEDGAHQGEAKKFKKNEDCGPDDMAMAERCLAKSSVARAMRSYDTKMKKPAPAAPAAPATAPAAPAAPATAPVAKAIPALGRALRLNAADKKAAAPKPAPTPPAITPVAKAGPPPIPPSAVKHPSRSPEGLPLAGGSIPPRVPGSAHVAAKGTVPAGLPGMTRAPGTPVKLVPSQPVVTPKGPRAPTMGSAKVPTAKAESTVKPNPKGPHLFAPGPAIRGSQAEAPCKHCGQGIDHDAHGPKRTAKAEPGAQSPKDRAATAGADKEIRGFKSLASSPTKIAGGGQMSKAELCKTCSQPMSKSGHERCLSKAERKGRPEQSEIDQAHKKGYSVLKVGKGYHIHRKGEGTLSGPHSERDAYHGMVDLANEDPSDLPKSKDPGNGSM